MKIKWLGHASFLITSDSGTRIITDPYTPGDKLIYGKIEETADIVTVSHDHFDHNDTSTIKGKPVVVKGTAEVKGIKFRGIPTYHDGSKGGERGKNTVICFEVDGIKVCHLGDLGHALGDEEAKAMGAVDVMLVPVGGLYTIDAATAGAICDKLNPKILIPMHFRNKRCDFPIAGVDEFTSGRDNVTDLEVSEVELHAGKLPALCQITVLEPAL